VGVKHDRGGVMGSQKGQYLWPGLWGRTAGLESRVCGRPRWSAALIRTGQPATSRSELGEGLHPISDPAHPPGSLVPRLIWGGTSDSLLLMMQNLTFASISGPLPFPSPHAAARLHLCAFLSSLKKSC